MQGLREKNNYCSSFSEFKITQYTNYLVEWIKQKVADANCKGCIVGISGGIDSALVCALAKKAFPNDTIGIIMPIDNMNHDLQHIDELSSSIGLKFKTVNLKNTYEALLISLNNEVNNQMSLSNIKPRLRMTTLYAYAQQNNYLVLGTDNLDEYYIGYYTKYGDGGVDLLPISHLLKSEVRALAEHLNVPKSIINKQPSAGLWEGQSDENELGFTYKELDSYLLDNLKNVSEASKIKIERMHKFSEHKRNTPDRPLSIDKYFETLHKN
ncbi:NAD(+) synthase [Mycoplasmopsis felifaucium]|uniref:NAD(+) synthase n=1 Tax=Mycoplasmopsis felifaucium TaxID=35768 RepID=UPI000A02E84C|nr:NAD(+) synthase [Mycoplasmopsis felifaucium]